MPFLEDLQNQIMFFDGAMGTMLQQAGLQAGEKPEEWNFIRPEMIQEIHTAYLRAGCQILSSNTFGANSIKMGECAAEAVARGVALARQAVDQWGRPNCYVACDIGPTGKLLQPIGDLSFQDAYDTFAQMVRAGEKAGADLILLETFSDTLEIKAALLAAKENSKLPVAATMIFDAQGKLLTGADIPGVVALLEGLGADAIGMNCGLGPDQFEMLLPAFLEYSSLPVIVNPNAGMPRTENGQTVFDVPPETYAASMERMARRGARLLGGCCGTTPAHLEAMVKICRDLPPLPVIQKKQTLVSSYSKTVEIGEKPVIIGERINPTGKKLMKQALREKDLTYVVREGLMQKDHGAHILDVNVGLPEIDEKEMMDRVLFELQSVIDLPLQIDSSSPRVLESALRAYNGKAMVNSVSGKRESMEAVFPLVAKYGGVVVALTLDENGIPETAEGRLAIAEKIVRTAASYGIQPKDIVVDALTMTVSSATDAAKVTLAAVGLIKEKLGVRTILGVSNVSFGLPQREILNAGFYTLALYRGLDAAIINPASEAMMRAYYGYLALMGLDTNFDAYIHKFSQAETPVPAVQSANQAASLYDAVLCGLKAEAAGAAKAYLDLGKEPLKIINEELVPALDVVGKGFEEGTVFLPKLLMSAEAAKSAFEVIKEHLMRLGKTQEKREKIILATVKGDIHDIGKNIVKVLLENYGYDVIDLGKDVAEEKIVEEALKNQVQLIGLSALMTTTVLHMESTIQMLKKAKPDCKVMVGGAVLTQEYADQIGADFYGKDAMASVYYAQQLFHHTT